MDSGKAERAGRVFKGRSLTVDVFFLPPSFCSFTISLGQALIVGILQFGEKIMPISYWKGISGRRPLFPQRPELETSIVVSIFLYFTSLWTSLPSSLPSLRPTQFVCEESYALPLPTYLHVLHQPSSAHHHFFPGRFGYYLVGLFAATLGPIILSPHNTLHYPSAMYI